MEFFRYASVTFREMESLRFALLLLCLKWTVIGVDVGGLVFGWMNHDRNLIWGEGLWLEPSCD